MFWRAKIYFHSLEGEAQKILFSYKKAKKKRSHDKKREVKRGQFKTDFWA